MLWRSKAGISRVYGHEEMKIPQLVAEAGPQVEREPQLQLLLYFCGIYTLSV